MGKNQKKNKEFWSKPKPLSNIWAVTILFIGLKLTGHIDWSWWWVLSPILIMALLRMFMGFLARVADSENKK